MENKELRSSAEAPSSKAVDLTTIRLEEPDGGIFAAYSNVVNMDWTLFDLRLRFGELMQVGDDESPSWQNQHGIVLEHAAIRIPWQQAKVLRDMLVGVIKNYEEINGELKQIKLPAAP
jgi:hypothetical protein